MLMGSKLSNLVMALILLHSRFVGLELKVVGSFFI